MHLRKLQSSDAELMLEWMKDSSVTEDLATDFSSKTIDDCKLFIENSLVDKENIHMAIASDEGEYMGTVSLEHINMMNLSAELKIIVRSAAMAKGYAWFGIVEIIKMAFEELGLNSVYWCVFRQNKRAIRFYDKHGFHENVDISESILARYNNVNDIKWYSVLKGDDYQNVLLNKGMVAGCRIVSIKTIPTVEAGELSFFEANHDIPFDIKRIYYISKVPEGVRRGYHAHRKLKQLLYCPYGKIQLILDNGIDREEITLSDPSVGIVIDKPVWREMLWLETNSVLCVAASDYYEVSDYIRNYDEFKAFIGEDN